MTKIFSVDYRSLRLFRFGLGVFAFVDIAIRLTNFTALHTEAGLIPSSIVEERLSLYLMSSSPLWTGFLFALSATAGVLLMLNFQTRWVSLGAFVLFLSLRNRNPFVMYGGDDLFRLGLLWSSLLPRGPSRPGETTFCTAASAGALLQLWLVYFCAGLAKSSADWFHNPHATFIALSSDTYAKPLARLVVPYWSLLKVSSISVFIIERCGWLLFFFPWRNAEARVLGFAIFSLLHLSFGLFMHLELFPLIDIVMLTLLLPEKFWNWLKVHDPLPLKVLPFYEQSLHQAAVVLFAILTYVNISSIPEINHDPLPPVKRIARVFGIYQGWNMFTPIVDMTDGFYRVIGRTDDGLLIDEINQTVLETLPMKPADPQALQGGFRWTRYFETINYSPNEAMQAAMISYFCKRWRPTHAGRAAREISLFHYAETTLAPALPVLGNIRMIFEGHCQD